MMLNVFTTIRPILKIDLVKGGKNVLSITNGPTKLVRGLTAMMTILDAICADLNQVSTIYSFVSNKTVLQHFYMLNISHSTPIYFLLFYPHCGGDWKIGDTCCLL